MDQIQQKKSLEFSYKNLQTHIFQGLFSEFGLPFQFLRYVLILCYSSEQSHCTDIYCQCVDTLLKIHFCIWCVILELFWIEIIVILHGIYEQN